MTHVFNNDEYKFIKHTLISDDYFENSMLYEENASLNKILFSIAFTILFLNFLFIKY